MIDNIDKATERYRNSKPAKFYGCVGCSLFIISLGILTAGMLLFAPSLILGIGWGVEDISNKLNSEQNITEIIKDPTKKGAEIKKESNNTTLSWDALGGTLQELKNAKTTDIERLAKSVYTQNDYDKCIVKKHEYGIGYDVEFSKNGELIYTVTFTGN